MDKVPLSQPSLTFHEYFATFRALRSGWLTQNGPEVKNMQDTLTRSLRLGSDQKSVTSVSNGTTALHLALLALHIGPGDEVIVCDFSYIAPVNAVLYVGATPVVIDCNRETWNVEPNLISNAINERTKAIIVVDNYGRLADLSVIKSIIGDKIKIILDAAESFSGESSDGRWVIPDLCTFSFYANKIFTCGEGGAIAADQNLIERINLLKSQWLETPNSFRHAGVGYNYRLTNISAAIFNAHWKRREKLLNRRREIFEIYRNLFSAEIDSGLIKDNSDAAPWLYTVDTGLTGNKRDTIRARLEEINIETRPGFTPISEHVHLSSSISPQSEFTNSKFLSDSLISLPTYYGLTNHQIKLVSSRFKEALKSVR